jgi:hypothetical protein
MSSTVNVQNLLTSVFRPRYTYDTTLNFFQVRVEISNVDSVFANVLWVSNAYVGDANSNVYVGVKSGNLYTTPQASYRNTALGAFAASNVQNVSNSVFVGYLAGQNVGTLLTSTQNSVLIGTSTFGNGSSNVFIGTSNGVSSGSCNVFLGENLTYSNATSNNTLLIGNGKPTLFGDLSGHSIGIRRFPIDQRFALDISGYVNVTAGLGINADPQDHTLNVGGDMYVSDGNGVFELSNLGTGVSVLNYNPVFPSTATVNLNAVVNIKNKPIPFIQYGKAKPGLVTLPSPYPNTKYSVQLTSSNDNTPAFGHVFGAISASNFTFDGNLTTTYYWTTFGEFPA